MFCLHFSICFPLSRQLEPKKLYQLARPWANWRRGFKRRRVRGASAVLLFAWNQESGGVWLQERYPHTAVSSKMASEVLLDFQTKANLIRPSSISSFVEFDVKIDTKWSYLHLFTSIYPRLVGAEIKATFASLKVTLKLHGSEWLQYRLKAIKYWKTLKSKRYYPGKPSRYMPILC